MKTKMMRARVERLLSVALTVTALSGCGGGSGSKPGVGGASGLAGSGGLVGSGGASGPAGSTGSGGTAGVGGKGGVAGGAGAGNAGGAGACPSAAGALTNVTAISMSGAFACALSDGDVYCWGDNALGELGDGHMGVRHAAYTADPAASKVQGLPGAASAVVANAESACAIVSGDVYCWGANADGELGLGDNGSLVTGSGYEYAVTAGKVPGLSGIQTMAAGAWGGSPSDPNEYFCATNGKLIWCWGSGTQGETQTYKAISLNTGKATEELTLAVSSYSPALISGVPSTITRLVAAGTVICAQVNTNDLYCWGSYALGSPVFPPSTQGYALPGTVIDPLQYSPGSQQTVSLPVLTYAPTPIAGLPQTPSISSIYLSQTSPGTSSSYVTTLAVVYADGSVWTWGGSSSTTQPSSGTTPAAQSSLAGTSPAFTAAFNLLFPSCSITTATDSAITCQPGSTVISAASTTLCSGPLNETLVATGSAGTADGCYITGGMVYCFGSDNAAGQLGDNTFNNITTTSTLTGKYPAAVQQSVIEDGPVVVGPALPVVPYDAGTPPDSGLYDGGGPGG